MILTPDIAVLGASTGGVMAAWRAAQAGGRVLLIAEHPWIGGQFTSQAVPPDEHPLIEHGGASESYRAFRDDIRRLYRAMPGFLDRAHLTPGTNPGDGWVSRLCFEPVHAARWFERLLAPEIAAGRLRVLRHARAIAAEVRGADVDALVVRRFDGREQWVQAGVFVDATDTGELLALARRPYRVGKESRADHGEPDAPDAADPLDQQPVTHVMALRRHARPGPVIDAPAAYARWREHRLPHHGHPLFSTALPGRERGQTNHLPLQVPDETAPTLDWWRYRRIVSAAQWTDARADVTLVNWAQNDYALHPLLDGPLPQAEVEAAARELSRCLLHWLQTEAPRADGGTGLPEWQPAADVLGTSDGLAQQAYVRESRRIVARETLTQRALQQPPAGRADAVGIGWYNLDIHPTCVSGHGVNAAVQPFELPLGSFIPADGGNLVPACKNIGVTHLVNACARVHPVEWLIGEVAGLLAAHRHADGWPDRPAQQAALFATVERAGIPRHWDPALLARRPAAH